MALSKEIYDHVTCEAQRWYSQYILDKPFESSVLAIQSVINANKTDPEAIQDVSDILIGESIPVNISNAWLAF